MNSYKETAQNENVAYQQLEPQMGFQYNQQVLPELAAPLTTMHQQQQRVEPVAPYIGSQLPQRVCVSGPTITVTEDGKVSVTFKRIRDRIKYTDYQLMTLENLYKRQTYISRTERKVLSGEIGVGEVNIKIWFQNRRMKTKAELKRKEKGLAKIRGRWMTKEVSSALIDKKTTNQAEQNFEWVSVPRVEEQTATTGAPVCYTWNTFPPIVEGQTVLSNFEAALHGYVQTGTAPAPENYTRHELPQMTVPFTAEQTATTTALESQTFHDLSLKAEGQIYLDSLKEYISTNNSPKKLDDLNEIVDRAAAVLDFKVPSHFEGVAKTPLLTAPNDMNYDPSIGSMIALGFYGVV